MEQTIEQLQNEIMKPGMAGNRQTGECKPVTTLPARYRQLTGDSGQIPEPLFKQGNNPIVLYRI